MNEHVTGTPADAVVDSDLEALADEDSGAALDFAEPSAGDRVEFAGDGAAAEAEEGVADAEVASEGGVEVAADVGDDAEGVVAYEGVADEEDAVEGGGIGAPSLRAALEALLLVTDEPTDPSSLAVLTKTPVAEVESTLRELAQEYDRDHRGFALVEIDGRWRYYTRDTCAEVVERAAIDDRHARLTAAALETLAVVAYSQPVTRGRVSGIRGVNVDGVMRTLVTRGLVTEAGVDQSTGAVLYSTTHLFLERLGISSLEELPQLAPMLPDLATAEDLIDAASV